VVASIGTSSDCWRRWCWFCRLSWRFEVWLLDSIFESEGGGHFSSGQGSSPVSSWRSNEVMRISKRMAPPMANDVPNLSGASANSSSHHLELLVGHPRLLNVPPSNFTYWTSLTSRSASRSRRARWFLYLTPSRYIFFLSMV
jgi:hypothetical protein